MSKVILVTGASRGLGEAIAKKFLDNNNIVYINFNKTTLKELEEKYNKFIETTYNTFLKEINNADCVGSISELYDSKMPYKAGGTCAQGWSVSEVLRIILEK